MKHEHADIFQAIANNVNVKLQRTNVGALNWETIDINHALSMISNGLGNFIRIAPITYYMAGKEVPFGMSVEPPIDTVYWVVDLFSIDLVVRYIWAGSSGELRYLKRGICHLTRADCLVQAEAIIVSNGGKL